MTVEDRDDVQWRIDYHRPTVILRLDFTEPPYPFLQSLSQLLVDIELAHDLGVLLTKHEYEAYGFGSQFWLRDGRPLAPVDRVRILSMGKHSPLFLELLITAVGGVWSLVQIMDKVNGWELNALSRQKLELEVAKLKKENELKEIEVMEKRRSVEAAGTERGAQGIYRELVARLERSGFVLENIELRRPER